MSDLDIEIGADTLPETPAPEAIGTPVLTPASADATEPTEAGQDRARVPSRPSETLAVKLAVTGAGTLLVALATVARLWFAPFLVGLAIGALGVRRGRRARSCALCATLAGLAGWAAPLVVRSLEGQPVLATARVAAAFAGLPPTGWIIVVAGLLVAVVQALLGTWLARSAGALGTAFTTARRRRSATQPTTETA